MSFLQRQVAHCDVCGHEWIVIAKKTPIHCASCKSRKWNKGAQAAAKDFVRAKIDATRANMDATAASSLAGVKWPTPEDIPERTVEYEE